MNDLKSRQEEVLRIIVSTYVKTISPVGSCTIAKSYPDVLSAATIRSEMHDLEEREYIQQPHTSAGRVPTDKGYRYYVDHLMPEPKVQSHVAALVAREYRERMDNVETLIERTSKILSTLSDQAGFVVFPDFEGLALKRVETTLLSRNHLLVVWVSNNGFVHHQVIDMKDEIPNEEITQINRFLNEELRGMLFGQIKPFLTQKLKVSHDSFRSIYKLAYDIVCEGFPREEQRRFSLQGSRHVLEQPEFQDWEKSRKLFKALETKEAFMNLFQMTYPQERVQVQIGFEHHCRDIWDCSLVTAQYYANQKIVGTLGVLGPRRMPYEKIFGLVDFVSRRFGEALEQWL